jgi:hypothetical protein
LKPKKGDPGHLSVSLPYEMFVAVDEEAARQTKAKGLGQTVTRSDIVKAALAEYLKKPRK